MKKKNYLFMTLVMSALLISCGGKKDGKEGSSTEITSGDNDIPLDQLICENTLNLKENATYKDDITDIIGLSQNIKRKGEKENFTGVGVEKDQNDSILDRAEIKNGWLVRYTHRIKKENRYITISDLTYDNGKINKGFSYHISHDEIDNWNYLSNLKKYNNGVGKIDWEITIKAHDRGYTNVVKNEIGETSSSDELIGTTLKFENLKLVKTLVGSLQSSVGFGEGYIFLCKKQDAFCDDDKEAPMIEKILKNLKIEVKGFDYWVEVK